MLQMDEKHDQIYFTVSSEMRMVDMIVREGCRFLEQHGVMRFSEFKLLTRELLINAIEHGNRNDSSLNVMCQIVCLHSKRFKITVEDEGAGFDYEKIGTDFPEPTNLRERGFPIIHSIADNLEFNEKGNCVSAYMSIEEDIRFNTNEENGVLEICPSGDITATCASKLCELLKDRISEGVRHYRFDLQLVEDIDSIGLSTIIVLYRTLNKGKSEFKLEIINASDAVKKLLQMTQLDQLYKVF